MPLIRVAQVLMFLGTAPDPDDPEAALVTVHVFPFSFIPVEISSADPTSDSTMVSVIQISPAMQKCLSLEAVWQDSSFKAEQALEVPAQFETEAVLGTDEVV